MECPYFYSIDNSKSQTLGNLKIIIVYYIYIPSKDNINFRNDYMNRIINMHNDYEKIIERNGLTNGGVYIAFRVTEEAYENHMRNHTFVEDVRGYNG